MIKLLKIEFEVKLCIFVINSRKRKGWLNLPTVLVTGANKGIGFEIAKVFGIKGWHVLLGTRNEQRGSAAIRQLEKQDVKNINGVHIDLTDPVSLQAAAARIEHDFSDLSLLVNNAGISGDQDTISYKETLSALQDTMQTNFFGTFTLTQQLLPILTKNQGRIVNVTIPTDANPFWNPLAYKTSKAALNVMTAAFAIDFEKHNLPVEIFSVHPGPTTTDLNHQSTGKGFHKVNTVAEKFFELLTDGQHHQGAFIEIFPQIRA